MIIKDLLTLLTLGLVCIVMSGAAFARDPDPLFADDTILEAKLTAPFKQIMKERSNDEEISGTFELVNTDGSSLEFAVQLRTRGNYRRLPEICRFAPLRLNFKKGDLDDTLLDKQDKLKLVTHCKNKLKNYQQAVIKEYLAYRALNILTDISFRTRLLRMTYVYSDDSHEEVTYAILIESKERLAKRLNLEEHESNSVSLALLNQAHTNLGSVFEFMIGNLDFSPVLGRVGEPCCHNNASFKDEGNEYWSIPYDFDLTGFVDVPYMEPNPKYNQRSTRHRIYRGRCHNQEFLPATLQKFRDKRPEFEALVAAQPELSKTSRKKIESFLEDFYELLDEEDKLIKRFADACI